MGQQSMVGLLLKGRRLWHKGSLISREDLSPQLSMCCSFHSTHQHADVVQLNNIRASPPGYEGPVVQNGGLLCSCTHRLRVMETLPGDILSNKKTLGFFHGGQCSKKNASMDCFIRHHHGDFSCHPKLFNTTNSEPASTSRSNTSCKTLSKISVFGATSSLEYGSGFVGSIPQIRTCSGLWSRRRKDPLWIGRRSFVSAGTYSNLKSGSLESPVFRMAATDATEAETNASSSESDEDYDFRNFPALTSSFYQDYERPSEMKPKKPVAWQISRKLFDTDKLTLESIPQPKGRTYDFGLGDMFSKPPPLEEGARPQGGFDIDIDISLDECEEAPSERLSSFPQRMPSHKLPWDTPEADNWSEISTDFQDSVSKHEQEFCWDPYDFDASVKLPHKLEIEENFSANVAAQ